MIIVSGEFVLKPDTIDAARAAAIDMMNETAKEDGCIHYRFYQDVEHAERFHVYEEWESPEHLAAHAKTAHMATFREALGKLGLVSRDVKMIEAGEVKGL